MRSPAALAFVVSLAISAGASAADPATLASSGADGLAPCASCHGQGGEGMAIFPKLAGMDAEYLTRQLEDFASGTRPDPVMAPIAQALSPENRVAISRFYADMPAPVVAAAETGNNALGERLALQGAWGKGVPACVQCHGPEGRGVGAAFPALAGQVAEYLSGELKAFREGERRNDPLQLMRSPAAQLSDEEIEAVALWFSTRPATAPGEAPP